jgi:hypothetical protein
MNFIKKITILITIIFTSNLINSQTVNIPDANFKAELINNNSINTNSDTEIQISEALAYSGTIDVSSKGISDLTGIEAFTQISELNCSFNQLSSLDISNNTNLTFLDCGYNSNISTLNVLNNTSLTYLHCGQNSISTLDLSNNISLETLFCFNNELTNLDVSLNTSLLILYCGGNQLTNLNITNNLSLIDLECGGSNIFTTLDLSNNIALKFIHITGSQLIILDLSNNTNLIEVYAGYSNTLTNIDFRNGNNTVIVDSNRFQAEYCPNLTCILVDDIAYSNLNWTRIDNATTFVETEEECNLLSVDDYNEIGSLKIYPNPTSKILNVNIPINKLIIYNLQGKKLLESKKQNINIESLSKGMYLIQIVGKENDLMTTTKLIKK